MKTVELFSGTKSFSKVMEAHGHETFTIDNDPSLEPDMAIDMLQVGYLGVKTDPDILWASPPCQGFSVAAIGKNWRKRGDEYIPDSQSARDALKLVERTMHIIEQNLPMWWFIENPRGMLRKVIDQEWLIRGRAKRVTVSYCQYGDTRQKPTDIWTNARWWNPKPICSPGASCHEAAPRGSRTGTQGIKGAKDRGKIPPALFEEILEQMP